MLGGQASGGQEPPRSGAAAAVAAGGAAYERDNNVFGAVTRRRSRLTGSRCPAGHWAKAPRCRRAPARATSACNRRRARRPELPGGHGASPGPSRSGRDALERLDAGTVVGASTSSRSCWRAAVGGGGAGHGRRDTLAALPTRTARAPPARPPQRVAGGQSSTPAGAARS